MRGLFDADAYAFSALSLPYLVVTAGVFALVVYLLFTRGHPIIRVALLAGATCGLVFCAGQTAALCCVDPEVAVRLYRIAVAPVSFVGPVAFALTLSVGNRLHHHRLLLAVAIAAASVTAALTLGTDLVIQDVRDQTAKLGETEFQAAVRTTPALRKLFPALLIPSRELDGLIALGVKAK